MKQMFHRTTTPAMCRLAGLLLACLLRLPMQGFAQTDTLPPLPIFTLGLIDGTNMIRLASGNQDHADHLVRNDGVKLGFDVGLSLNFPLNRNVRLRLLPIVCLSTLKYNIVEKPFTGTFLLSPLNVMETANLNLPLMIQVKKRQFKTIRPWFQAGIQPNINLAKKSSANARGPLLTVGMVAEIGFDVSILDFTFSPEIRVMQGLTNIQDRVAHPTGQILPALFLQMLSLNIAFE